jgi:hypothetical protein
MAVTQRRGYASTTLIPAPAGAAGNGMSPARAPRKHLRSSMQLLRAVQEHEASETWGEEDLFCAWWGVKAGRYARQQQARRQPPPPQRVAGTATCAPDARHC